MKTMLFSRLTLDDLIFENRNKIYGAFILRKKHERHLAIGLLSAIVLMALFILFSISTMDENRAVDSKDLKEVIQISNLSLIPPTKTMVVPATPKRKAPRKPKRIDRFLPPVITDKVVSTDAKIPTNKMVAKAPLIGADSIGLPLPGSNPFKNSAAGLGGVSKKSKIFNAVEQRPEFPGGVAALYTFLHSHIHYPETARQNGVEGTVFVTFVVNSDGTVSDIEIMHGVADQIDREVIEVLGRMPKWHPGKQNGQAVNVQFELPINFKIY